MVTEYPLRIVRHAGSSPPDPGCQFIEIKEQQMVTAAVILSFIISIVLVLVAVSQIDA